LCRLVSLNEKTRLKTLFLVVDKLFPAPFSMKYGCHLPRFQDSVVLQLPLTTFFTSPDMSPPCVTVELQIVFNFFFLLGVSVSIRTRPSPICPSKHPVPTPFTCPPPSHLNDLSHLPATLPFHSVTCTSARCVETHSTSLFLVDSASRFSHFGSKAIFNVDPSPAFLFIHLIR